MDEPRRPRESDASWEFLLLYILWHRRICATPEYCERAWVRPGASLHWQSDRDSAGDTAIRHRSSHAIFPAGARAPWRAGKALPHEWITRLCAYETNDHARLWNRPGPTGEKARSLFLLLHPSSHRFGGGRGRLEYGRSRPCPSGEGKRCVPRHGRRDDWPPARWRTIGNVCGPARQRCGSSEIREEMDQTQAAESAQAFSDAAQTGRGARIANGKYPFRCWRASIAANTGVEQGTMVVFRFAPVLHIQLSQPR